MSDLFDALANPARRQILVLLRERDLSAGEIADQVPIAKSTLSQHFNVLKAADLVRSQRKGTTIIYSINASVLEEGLMGLMRLLKIEKKQAGLVGKATRAR